MDSVMKLKSQLALLLDRHDMTSAQLSRKASVPTQTISNWLSGKKPKDFDQVKRVADALGGVSLDYLLFGVEPTKKPAIEEHESEILAGVFEVVLRRPRK